MLAQLQPDSAKHRLFAGGTRFSPKRWSIVLFYVQRQKHVTPVRFSRVKNNRKKKSSPSSWFFFPFAKSERVAIFFFFSFWVSFFFRYPTWVTANRYEILSCSGCIHVIIYVFPQERRIWDKQFSVLGRRSVFLPTPPPKKWAWGVTSGVPLTWHWFLWKKLNWRVTYYTTS